MTPPANKHIFISCGEASGDRYGAALIAALRSSAPDLQISALGGQAISASGARIVRDSEDLAVMGFSDVVMALPRVMSARRDLMRYLQKARPDLVIPIDFPGFNGGLAGKAKSLGLPVYWLIAPQVWAWGGWRTGGFRKKMDRLGTILPFETDFFRNKGFSVFPMGHPLMEDYGLGFPFEESLARREGVFNSRLDPITVGVIPGSRRQEIDHLLPVLRVTCQALVRHFDQREVRFLVSAAPGVDPQDLSGTYAGDTEISQEPLHEIMPRMDLALVCSGTASLEVALAGVPHEVVYRTGALNYWVGRRLMQADHFALSNLILNRPMVRELLQDQVAPLPLARNILRWVGRPAERQRYYGDAKRLRQLCGKNGVWERTAADILEFLAARDAASSDGD